MTPTKRTLTDEEYDIHSSDTCPDCGRWFGIRAVGCNVTICYLCPHCGGLIEHKDLRAARERR